VDTAVHACTQFARTHADESSGVVGRITSKRAPPSGATSIPEPYRRGWSTMVRTMARPSPGPRPHRAHGPRRAGTNRSKTASRSASAIPLPSSSDTQHHPATLLVQPDLDAGDRVPGRHWPRRLRTTWPEQDRAAGGPPCSDPGGIDLATVASEPRTRAHPRSAPGRRRRPARPVRSRVPRREPAAARH